MDWSVNLWTASVTVPSFDLSFTLQITQKSKETNTFLISAYSDSDPLGCSMSAFAILERAYVLVV